MLLFPLLLILCCSLFAGASAFTVYTFNNSQVYNRHAAKEYIETHLVETQYNADPNYHYFPYDPLTDSGGDCTNFASHVLRAGGIPFKQGLPIYLHNWYYYSVGNRSGTWTSAHNFRSHFGVVNGEGYKRSYQMRKYSPSEIWYKGFLGIWMTNWDNWDNLFNNIGVGDIVQYTFVDNGKTTHSQIVHRKSQGEEGGTIKRISMAQHTDDEWWSLRNFIRTKCFTTSTSDTPLRWITVIRLNSSTPWTFD